MFEVGSFAFVRFGTPDIASRVNMSLCVRVVEVTETHCKVVSAIWGNVEQPRRYPLTGLRRVVPSFAGLVVVDALWED